jgi:hypothetical protein
MNEQLKKIMLESGTHKYISAECQHRIELIAELIVRECADIANSGIDPAESHLPGNDILEHFGVKE